MKNKRGHDANIVCRRTGIIHFLPLLLITGLMIAVVGGILYFNQSSDTPLITKSSPSPESQSEEVDTSDWEIYVNTEVGLRFKYPQNWINLYEGKGDRYPVYLFPSDLGEELIPIEIFFLSDSNIEDAIEYHNTFRTASEILERTDIFLNGKQAVSIVGIQKDEKLGNFYLTVFDSKQYTVKAQLIDSGYLDIYNQILSTFEFVE